MPIFDDQGVVVLHHKGSRADVRESVWVPLKLDEHRALELRLVLQLHPLVDLVWTALSCVATQTKHRDEASFISAHVVSLELNLDHQT